VLTVFPVLFIALNDIEESAQRKRAVRSPRLVSNLLQLGLVACEAMACGTPVLATASDGLPEIIDHQRNGWLVKFGDQQELV
jgi:glycosyltransferase involved in cell wall biosynthesis